MREKDGFYLPFVTTNELHTIDKCKGKTQKNGKEISTCETHHGGGKQRQRGREGGRGQKAQQQSDPPRSRADGKTQSGDLVEGANGGRATHACPPSTGEARRGDRLQPAERTRQPSRPHSAHSTITDGRTLDTRNAENQVRDRATFPRVFLASCDGISMPSLSAM